jgi:hypothetical protein
MILLIGMQRKCGIRSLDQVTGTRTIILLTFCWVFSLTAGAQKPDPGPDSSYYKSFSGSIIPRVFLSRNYSELKFDPPGSLPAMKYHANTPLNVGIGAAWRYISFSLSKGLGFLQSDSKKGNTKSFDLQTHVYRRKWAFDALAQFYQGYYLGQPNIGIAGGSGYYLRPDMRLRMVGITGYRILNDRRFSYGSVLGQGGYQQQSAGSFLLGANAFYTAINADSAFAPYKIDSNYNKEDIRKMHLFLMGVGAGYAYTYVYRKHFFLHGSVNANLDLNFSREIGGNIGSNKVDLSHNFIFRFGTGYNTYRWGISLLWFTGGISARGNYSGYGYSQQIGSYKLVYVWRIPVNSHLRRMMKN